MIVSNSALRSYFLPMLRQLGAQRAAEALHGVALLALRGGALVEDHPAAVGVAPQAPESSSAASVLAQLFRPLVLGMNFSYSTRMFDVGMRHGLGHDRLLQIRRAAGSRRSTATTPWPRRPSRPAARRAAARACGENLSLARISRSVADVLHVDDGPQRRVADRRGSASASKPRKALAICRGFRSAATSIACARAAGIDVARLANRQHVAGQRLARCSLRCRGQRVRPQVGGRPAACERRGEAFVVASHRGPSAATVQIGHDSCRAPRGAAAALRLLVLSQAAASPSRRRARECSRPLRAARRPTARPDLALRQRGPKCIGGPLRDRALAPAETAPPSERLVLLQPSQELPPCGRRRRC